MNRDATRAVLVCGGAGFLGSHLVEVFAREGWDVTVLDPCHPRTGGKEHNLTGELGRISWIRQPLEGAAELGPLLERVALVVDAVGFTHHREGLAEPTLDLQLNYLVHLRLIEALNRCPRRLIYLGSRGQYGRVSGLVTETAPQVPCDAQGVHKAATEAMIRIYSARHGWPATSLRLGNCFGPRQPMGADPGLVSEFFATVLAGKEVALYGSPDRMQQVLFAPDLARIVVRIAEVPMEGFAAFNVPGPRVPLAQLLDTLIRLAGRGSFSVRPFPPEVAALHGGEAQFSEARLKEVVQCEYTPLERALSQTLESLRDSARGA